MKHRIVVLGAGYAGAFAAGTLARRLSPADTEITVVNAVPDFVERMRLHQLAVGQDLTFRKLTDLFAGTPVRLRLARVTGVDPERRTVAVTGDDQLTYDTLLYTLGSTVAHHGVPGVAEYAFDVAGLSSALRLRERLAALGEGGAVLVVGEGLTGIETAAEFAESRPDLSVALAARGELGAGLSPKARRHLRRAFDRLGITVHEHTGIEAVEPGRAIAADGTSITADVTVWAAGFAMDPIAADSGLEVTGTGRIVVDRTMRSVSHPDVYAAGDCAYAIGDNGRPLPMSCASAGATDAQATAAIVARLTGGKVPVAGLKYYGNHISLGRRDAIFQMVDGNARAKSWYLGGRTAARLKSGVLKGAAWGIAHPTFGMPRRRHPLTTRPDRAGVRAAA
ncbi:NAD(P)/FAD-dependent oxidoreductase [Streptomyces acidiscabies]|uniref:FAD-dependent oxidoreductase n=1 Tax=Streptomyces acidiscabies TaxID=42234 RepID=A0AAP6BEV3_9ACTN|nr:FAD-dependent oxidoreductase [Streptomyces acidiscabies]MBP5942060.1 oxidoreductase [Streptomyces sp. LBUM 1476]MBZ3913546.1 FAD-dependent oxidoreductase [Streptomyces acidiscabies]MDX2963383.1 FAD-dependent oxidoreductase [Streptomyces acidiscabies]MDX3023117.1 FAD-dependent oxidoreductase [Streptomyces acidiscabies]MDX3792739.1 FAD-dependent oxidoreductase [Streptomyces acidiscabies]